MMPRSYLVSTRSTPPVRQGLPAILEASGGIARCAEFAVAAIQVQSGCLTDLCDFSLTTSRCAQSCSYSFI